MDEELDIIVTGFEVPERLAEAGLVRIFGLDIARARLFVRGLPRIAKRCENAGAAEHYASALRSIGARIELRSAADGYGASRRPHSSLPVPAPSALRFVDQAARVEYETARAVARFRASEGLEGAHFDAEIDPVNPRIPKAPPLPHDLARMPNGALLRASDHPDWMLSDPLVQSDALVLQPDAAATVPARPGSRPTRSAGPRRAGGAADSIPPHTIGLAHAARASVRPGLGLLSSWRPKAIALRRWRPRDFIAALALLAALSGAVLWWSGVFDSDESRRAETLRAQGIDPGRHALAGPWAQQPNHHVRGIEPAPLHDLLAKLARAGAVAVFALRIESSANGETAAGLLIELPTQAAARRTVLWRVAEALHLEPPLIPDPGGRYYVLEFSK